MSASSHKSIIKEEKLVLTTDGNNNYRWESRYHPTAMLSPIFVGEQAARDWMIQRGVTRKPSVPTPGWTVIP